MFSFHPAHPLIALSFLLAALGFLSLTLGMASAEPSVHQLEGVVILGAFALITGAMCLLFVFVDMD